MIKVFFKSFIISCIIGIVSVSVGYADNVTDIYKNDGIYLSSSDGSLTATAIRNGKGNEKLFAACFRDGILDTVNTVGLSDSGGVSTAQCVLPITKGCIYKFFLIDVNNLKPICPKKQFYSYTDEDYELLKDKWVEFLVGNDSDIESDIVRNRINSIYEKALTLENSLNKTDNATSLWGASYGATSDMSSEYYKIYEMALAYGTKGQALYHNTKLKDDIIYALDWMYENRYGQDEIDGTGWRNVNDYNWWDWFVASPEYMLDTMMILHEELTQKQIDEYLSLYTYLKTFMRTDLTSESEVNGRAYNAFAAAILQKDEATIKTMTQAYKVIFETVESGTGMYEDYSYVKHNMIPYNGNYGTDALLDRIVRIMSVTCDTPFELEEAKSHIYENWIYNAFEPLMANAGIMSMVRGRSVDANSEYEDGLIVFESILNMIDNVSQEDALNFKLFIKRHLKDDKLAYAYERLSLPQLIKLESILNDSSIPEAAAYENTRVYYNMDRVVHHKDGWTAGIAMSSERIANYESIGGNNKKGWYTGDGMLYLYTNMKQYEDIVYFKYADPYKRPGTTVDSQEREAVNIKYGKEYFSRKDFVGGVTMDDSYAVAAMELESFHNDTQPGEAAKDGSVDPPLHDCDLTAKKAWFLFDDEIVCLGADIYATADYEVFTTVENRRIPSASKLTVNDLDIAFGSSGNTPNPVWAHIEGTGGYYYPDGGNLYYRQITNNYNFFEMWLSHGNAPDNKTYAYVMLPMKTKEETEAYSKNPKIDILCNRNDVQAVYQKELGITGYVFWKAAEFDGIELSAPAALMKKQDENGINISFSDPTHKLSNITITIDGEYTAASCDKEITVCTTGGKTIIQGDLSGISGKTLGLTLNQK